MPTRLDALHAARDPLAVRLGDAHDALDDALTAGDARAALRAAAESVALRDAIRRADALIRAELSRRRTGQTADEPAHAAP